jgi:dipeptidyl aminopeptidase/acylaminoacyl peptidase
MNKRIRNLILGLVIVFISGNALFAQEKEASGNEEIKTLQKKIENLQHDFDVLNKGIDDLQWYNKVGDVAYIDKVFITGPPPAKVKNPTAMGAHNPVKFYTYIFIPKGIDPDKKYPLLILPHGGVHADFTTYHAHIIRELMAQQYIVVAPEYRGSTGYGKSFYEKIDYGGLEIEDVHAARNYMTENYEMVDKNRVGIIGWSHGGLIALMDVFEHPDDYQVCFAGVPVSDLIARLGYYDEEYRKEFSADYHIGKTVNEDVEEYKRRSPAWNAAKLRTPLLIHTNTIDDDVNVLEVEHLIQALKAENKKFEYEIFQNVEGGHSFDRIDTRVAKEIRLKIYRFLDKYLDPPRKLKSIRDIDRAAYRPVQKS